MSELRATEPAPWAHAIASGAALCLVEAVALMASQDIFRFDLGVLLVAVVYAALPVGAVALGRFRGAVAPLNSWAACLGGLSTLAFVVWVHGQLHVFGGGVRAAVAACVMALTGVGVWWVRRRWRPSAITWLRVAVIAWMLPIAFGELAKATLRGGLSVLWSGQPVVTHSLALLVSAALITQLLRWPRALLSGVTAGFIGLASVAYAVTPPPVEGRQGPQVDVFYVVLDSLRYDFATPELMPRLEGLKAQGTSFEQVFSPSIMTKYSLPALLGAQRTEIALEGSLPDRLRAAGLQLHLLSDYPGASLSRLDAHRWDSVALPSPLACFRLTRLPYAIGAIAARDDKALFGLGGGKHPFGAGGAPAALAERLEKAQGPGFYWLHLGVPHSPYNEPPYRSAHPGPSEAEVSAMNHRFHAAHVRADGSYDVAARRGLYTLAVRAADETLGRILDVIEGRPSQRPALIVVTSDHGESFGERGTVGHSQSLFRSQHHVPLVIAGAPMAAGRRVNTPVSGRQLPATLLDVLGLEAGPGSLRRDLEADQQRTVVVTFPKGTVIQEGRWRLIFTAKAALVTAPKRWSHRARLELYDITLDPEERHNVADEHPAVVKRLTEQLKVHPAVSPKTRRALEEVD